MLYDIEIRNYKNILFQGAGWNAYGRDVDYHLVAQSQPYPDTCEVKEPYKNTWFDENGDDEYTAALFRKAFEFQVKFFIKAGGVAAMDDIRAERDRFLSMLMDEGEFLYYDGWQQIGFKGVRFVKSVVDQTSITDEDCWMIFTVTFKVNDPTNVHPSNGKLVE